MRRLAEYAVTAVIFAAIALAVSRLERVTDQTHAGRAVVMDGDSLRLGTERIRLRGIDAPEFEQTCMANGVEYACGQRAREKLASLIAGRTVRCSGWERDKYDRFLGMCEAGGMALNRAMVEAGWAVSYGDFSDAENKARRAKAGLWAGSFERPSQWRKIHGDSAEAPHDFLNRLVRWLREIVLAPGGTSAEN